MKELKNKKAKFITTILLAGKTATGICIPDEIVESFEAGKKPPVKVTIKGYTFRSTIAVMGGKYMVGISAEHRAGAKVNGGDKIEVTLELDTEPRVVDIPPDLKKALNKNPNAKKNFEALSYSKKQGFVIPVKEAKTEETKQRRIEKTIAALNE